MDTRKGSLRPRACTSQCVCRNFPFRA